MYGTIFQCVHLDDFLVCYYFKVTHSVLLRTIFLHFGSHYQSQTSLFSHAFAFTTVNYNILLTELCVCKLLLIWTRVCVLKVSVVVLFYCCVVVT